MPIEMDAFFQLMQLSAGTREAFSVPVPEAAWKRLFALASAHSLLGVTFPAVKQQGSAVPHDLLMAWWAAEEKTIQANGVLRQKSTAIQSYFKENGYRSCILKGLSAAVREILRLLCKIYRHHETSSLLSPGLSKTPPALYVSSMKCVAVERIPSIVERSAATNCATS